MTTTDQIDAIQARADAATEGPWKWGEETSEWGDCGPNLETVKRGQVYGDGSQGAADLIIGSWGHDANGITVEDANAEFIAHARTDVPALLALVRDQQARLDKVREWCDTNEYPTAVDDLPYTFSAQDYALDDAARRIRAAITATEGV